MADKYIPFYFKSVPHKTAYYPDSLGMVTPEKAKEYEFDGYGFPTDEVLPRKPYFNIPKLEDMQGKKLKKFIDDSTNEIIRINNEIESTGKEITSISDKVDELIKKRDKLPRGSYKYVMATKDIDEMADKLPPLDEKIREISINKKQLDIELLNARVKFVNEFFEKFKNHEAFSKIPKLAEELIKENSKAIEAYKDFTKHISVGYTSKTPFLNSGVVASMKSCLVNYEAAIDEMKANTENRYLSKLQQIFEDDFRSKLRAQDENDAK